MEDVRVVLFGSFNDTVHNGVGFRAINRVMEKEVLPADDVAFHLMLRAQFLCLPECYNRCIHRCSGSTHESLFMTITNDYALSSQKY